MPVPPVLVCVMSPFTESVLVPEFRISTYCSGKEFFAQSVSNGVAAPDTEVEKINKETTAHSILEHRPVFLPFLFRREVGISFFSSTPLFLSVGYQPPLLLLLFEEPCRRKTAGRRVRAKMSQVGNQEFMLIFPFSHHEAGTR